MLKLSSLRRLLSVAAIVAHFSVAAISAHAASAAATPSSTQSNGSFVAASDPRIIYEGRFDREDPAAPGVIWQASRITLEFSGGSLEIRFAENKGQNFFDAVIDGQPSVIELRKDQAPVGTQFSNLGSGRHRLTLFKRSEASQGTVRFTGVALAANGALFAPTATTYPVRFLFIGDSITVGACNEDGKEDQWSDFRTHNNASSYGAFTASAFSADYRNIAVSGMGIVTGYVPMKAGEIWDRVYPRSDSKRADLSSWVPEVIFVNLGENDDSFTTVKKQPFPAEAYTDGYVVLISDIRKAYPKARIVILRGGMFGGAQSERLRTPWEAAVAQIEAHDSLVAHFVFKHWSSTHPRVTDHRAMADELISWLKAQPFTANVR